MYKRGRTLMKIVDKLAVYDYGIIERDKNETYGHYEFKVRTGNILIPFINHEDALRNSVEHFADCAEKNCRSLSGPEQALRVTKILDQALAKL